MVKEIGMRVGGPSESQVRGMRSEGEMGERVREEMAPNERKTCNRRKSDKQIRDRMKK